MIPGNINTDLISGAEGAYQVERSLRLNASDSAYLSRTPASAGNRKTWTWSGWVKRSGLGTYQRVFNARNPGVAADYIRFNNDDTLELYFGATLITAQVFRDVSSWYYLTVAVDTTQATSSNRVKLYVNGTQVTTFATTNYPSQNADTLFNATLIHNIGTGDGTTEYFSGYLANVEFVDGSALTPASFGETNATTGQWVPKAYGGSYGTNGFRLTFSDNSGTTATTLGKDAAGSNNFTPNNFSVAAGAGNDSLVDTPTSYGTDTGVGGEVRGNYATLNPLAGVQTLANGNLDFTSVNTDSHRPATIAMTTGKWYCEFTASSAQGVPGLVAAGFTGTYPGSTATSWGWYGGGNLYNSGSPFLSAAFTAGDVVQLAFDADSGKLWFGKNGAWLSSGNPAAGTNQTATPGVGTWFFVAGGSSAGSVTLNANFGQRPFAYAAPSGFKALCDTSLPAPTIARPSTVMTAYLYTGNGSTAGRSLTGAGFSPDLAWIKDRSAGNWHQLRSTLQNGIMYSNDTAAEQTSNANGIIGSLDSDGFTLSTSTNTPVLNTNNNAYVAWLWDAGASTVTNTSGSISSQVRANASAGFSIVTWTGTGAVATIGHGLNIEPSFIITKRRNSTSDWDTYHKSLGNTGGLALNRTAAFASSSNYWNNTSPTSTVFTVGIGLNPSEAMLAYCFAPVAGYSAFGSYTGNGSADGPFVWCGFRPRWLMIKCSSIGDSFQHWVIFDTSRNAGNLTNLRLIANASTEEQTFGVLDILSNGFKIRYTDAYFNQSGSAWIYAAFAESPFQYARAR